MFIFSIKKKKKWVLTKDLRINLSLKILVHVLIIYFIVIKHSLIKDKLLKINIFYGNKL